jgi:leucyl-tRNA synthetase
MARYNAKESERHWQGVWDERALFVTPHHSDKPKCYVLEMFPYPSGRIHMGHTRNYTMGDVIARFRRSQGYNVLHPMGWDAFGLPAENAARDKGVSPRDWTYENIAAMRTQLKMMGLSIDWTREFATCDPAYYQQQQKLFLDFYKAGFVYRGEADVNWDPVDMTVLANEQVIDGRGWRSGALVERRKLSQWFFKITDFAEELLTALDTLDRWPEKVRIMQKNWIGRSEGLKFQPVLWRCRRNILWRRNWRRATRSWPPSSPNAARPARRKRKSKKPKSWAMTPASPPITPSIRRGG